MSDPAARPAFLERLAARVEATGSVLCLGIDPDPAALPPGFSPGLQGAERFARLLLDVAGPYAAAVKPNLAFFEAFGSAGLGVLERLRQAVPADLPVVIDAKRADIGTTAQRHATALLDVLGADAVTLNPYLGLDALEPLLARSDRFAYVLCRTSNPGAAEFQDLLVAGEQGAQAAEPLYVHVARRAAVWNERFGTVGLVVGATATAQLRTVREVAPSLPFLIPGLGAQGGDEAAVLEAAPATQGSVAGMAGRGLLVNVSRGIAHGAAAGDPGEGIRAAAQGWSERLRC